MKFMQQLDRDRTDNRGMGDGIRLSFLVMLGMVMLGMTVVGSSLAGQELGPAKIQLVDGTVLEGALISIDPQGVIRARGITRDLNLQDVLSLRTERTSVADPGSPIIIIPAGGGRWRGRNLIVGDDRIEFKSPTGPHKLPLQVVRAIVWSTSPSIENAVRHPSTASDKIIVATDAGERNVEGLIESIDGTSVHVNYKGESKKIGIGKVKAVIMADLDLPNPQSSMTTVNLVDGSQWVGAIQELLDGELILEIVGDATVKLKASDIVDMTIASDRVVFLSDLEPIDVQERPLFSIKRSYQRDRSVENNPMAIRNSGTDETVSFPKGLGVQAFSRIVYSKPDKFDRFKTTVGIDAETNRRGDCRMAVWGDGIELWAGRVRGTDGPRAVDLDITGMKEIMLVVDPGEKFDLGDHADWGNARFLNTK